MNFAQVNASKSSFVGLDCKVLTHEKTSLFISWLMHDHYGDYPTMA